MIRKGDLVCFKPEWRDPGDQGRWSIAVEDQDGDRVRVEAQLDLFLNPQSVVEVSMLVPAVVVSVSIGRSPDYRILILWGVYVLLSDGSTQWVERDIVRREDAVEYAKTYAARHGLEVSL